jgi:hypothetical protein
MKNLLPWLFCLILMGEQTMNYAVRAAGQTLSAGYISGITMGAIMAGHNCTPGDNNAADKAVKENVTIITTPQLMLRCTIKTEEKPNIINADTVIHTRSESGFIAPSNCFNLDSGNILVSPDRDIAISTSEGVVSIGSGATIFVMASTKGMVIYDLNQTKPKQVSIVVNRHKLVMEPGHMLVLTRQKAKNFEELEANCHRVSYRRPKEIDLHEDDMTAFAAGFSISSALVKIMPLKQLVNSTEKRDQLLLDKLIKTAVILGT